MNTIPKHPLITKEEDKLITRRLIAMTGVSFIVAVNLGGRLAIRIINKRHQEKVAKEFEAFLARFDEKEEPWQ